MSQKTLKKPTTLSSREQLHQMGMEYLLLARRDPHYYPQGQCVDYRYQSHDQERIIEHGGQSTRERGREIFCRSCHPCEFSIIAGAH